VVRICAFHTVIKHLNTVLNTREAHLTITAEHIVDI